jgi:ketosteroid isomerase-like protein
MARALMLVMVLACVATAGGDAQEAFDSDAASKLMALERIGKMQAWQNKDVQTLNTVFDNAFVYVDPEGRELSKPEMLAYIQRADPLQLIAEAMRVELHGDTAIVTGLYRMKGTERGKPFVRHGRFVDTWLQKNGHWVAIASVVAPDGF